MACVTLHTYFGDYDYSRHNKLQFVYIIVFFIYGLEKFFGKCPITTFASFLICSYDKVTMAQSA